MNEKPEWARMLNWVFIVWFFLILWYGILTLIRMAF